MRAWFQRYREKFKEDPTVLSQYGYQLVTLFGIAVDKAGPNLTPDTLAKALDNLVVPRDMFGADEQRFTPTRHLGSNRAKLCQIQSGKWVSITDYITD